MGFAERGSTCTRPGKWTGWAVVMCTACSVFMLVQQARAGDDCPAAGDCCTPHSTGGCENEACCNCVCACDPFCCHHWDSLCSGEGFFDGCGASNPDGLCTEECAACVDGPPVECSECAGDLDDSGDVGVPDLLALLGCWGDLASGCECATWTAAVASV